MQPPAGQLADFYREMGDLFGVELRPHNRWAGAKVLRQRWQTHIDASLSRPMLIVDEAQELSTVLSELRLLCSTRLDSHILLTVVLAGDGWLVERFAIRRVPLARQPHVCAWRSSAPPRTSSSIICGTRCKKPEP